MSYLSHTEKSLRKLIRPPKIIEIVGAKWSVFHFNPDKNIPKLENSYFPSKFHVESEFHMPNVPSVEGFEIKCIFQLFRVLTGDHPKLGNYLKTLNRWYVRHVKFGFYVKFR